MKNIENKEQIVDLMVNTIFIFNLQMSNKYKSVGFGMQRSKNDVLGVLVKSTTIFTQSSRILTISLELWEQRNRYDHQMCSHSQYRNGHNQQKVYMANEVELIHIMQGDYTCGLIKR